MCSDDTIKRIIRVFTDFDPSKKVRRQIIKCLEELIQLRKQNRALASAVALQKSALLMRNEEFNKLVYKMQKALGQEDKFKVGDIVWVEDDDGKRVKRVFWHFCGAEDYDGYPYVCFNPEDSRIGDSYDNAELCTAREDI